VFAERGFAGTTSKEICARAGTPLASVNYHFGSRDALYEAVLIEAHGQLIALDDIATLTQAAGDAAQRLRAVIDHVVRIATDRATPWGFRVMLRELLAPSPAIPALIEKAVRPKARLMLGLMSELLGLPPQHPAVQRGVMFTMLPCIAMMVAPKEMPARLLPAAVRDGDALRADFVGFVMAGLQAVAQPRQAGAAQGGAGGESTRSAL
jgi:AcrR family transcriptional regulator